MSMYLKIRECALTEEVRIFSVQRKRMERKRSKALSRGAAANSERAALANGTISTLQSHEACRRLVIRNVHLARSFLKGQMHMQVETMPKAPNRHESWQNYLRGHAAREVSFLVRDYGGEKYRNTTPDQIREWLFK